MAQFRITMVCDENYIADSLRNLANAVEEREDVEFEYETEHCYAEIEEE